MKRLLFGGESFVTGKDSLEYLKNITVKKAFIVAGSNSMMKMALSEGLKLFYKKMEQKHWCIRELAKIPIPFVF